MNTDQLNELRMLHDKYREHQKQQVRTISSTFGVWSAKQPSYIDLYIDFAPEPNEYFDLEISIQPNSKTVWFITVTYAVQDAAKYADTIAKIVDRFDNGDDDGYTDLPF